MTFIYFDDQLQSDLIFAWRPGLRPSLAIKFLFDQLRWLPNFHSSDSPPCSAIISVPPVDMLWESATDSPTARGMVVVVDAGAPWTVTFDRACKILWVPFISAVFDFVTDGVLSTLISLWPRVNLDESSTWNSKSRWAKFQALWYGWLELS